MKHAATNFELMEKLFLNLFCYSVNDSKVYEEKNKKPSGLWRFKQYFNNEFFNEIKGKTVIDIGCGYGCEVISLIENGAKYGIGMDIQNIFEQSIQKAERLGIREKVHYTTESLSNMAPSSIEVAMSQNAFEHIASPEKMLSEAYRLLVPGGKFFITFAPSWLHPYGAHLHYMTKLPWVHLIFSEKTILNVRKLYRSDGAERYEDVVGGLNKMTIERFLKYVSNSEFDLEYLNLKPMKRFPRFFMKIPGLREFTTGSISAILTKSI